MDIAKMTALELGKAIKNKEISVKDAVLSVFDAIEKKDKDINAYVSLCKEEALKKADEIQKKIDDGSLSSPIAGVPVSIKDNICTKGIKTTCSSKILGDFKPPYNATVIEKLENAGAIVIGKLNKHLTTVLQKIHGI